MYMNDSTISPHSRTSIVFPVGTTVDMTVEGRLARAVELLAAAQKTGKEKERKRLCEKVMMYLRPLAGVINCADIARPIGEQSSERHTRQVRSDSDAKWATSTRLTKEALLISRPYFTKIRPRRVAQPLPPSGAF